MNLQDVHSFRNRPMPSDLEEVVPWSMAAIYFLVDIKCTTTRVEIDVLRLYLHHKGLIAVCILRECVAIVYPMSVKLVTSHG